MLKFFLRLAIKKLKPLLLLIANFALPNRCLACGLITSNPLTLCTDCWNEIPRCDELSCTKCSLPIVGLVSENLFFDKKLGRNILKCDMCHANQNSFDALFSSCLYSKTTSILASGLKFGGRVENAEFFAKQILQRLQAQELFSFDIITCVPLSKKGLLMRRYNQAALIAKYIHKTLAKQSAKTIFFMPNLLIKVKHTMPQTKLNKQQRIANLKDCFAVNKTLLEKHPSLAEKTILVVDDVATTLATLNEASFTIASHPLLKAKYITCATFARVDIV